jgi:hypothetical protein
MSPVIPGPERRKPFGNSKADNQQVETPDAYVAVAECLVTVAGCLWVFRDSSQHESYSPVKKNQAFGI